LQKWVGWHWSTGSQYKRVGILQDTQGLHYMVWAEAWGKGLTGGPTEIRAENFPVGMDTGVKHIGDRGSA